MKYRSIAVVILALLGSVGMGRCAIIIMIEEVGDDVVVQGAGAVSIESLTQQGPFYSGSGGLFPSFNRIFLGVAEQTETGPLIQAFSGITRSIQFASPVTSRRSADDHSGDIFGIDEFFIILPAGYESGDVLSGTMIFRDENLESLGLTPGSYSTSVFSNPSVELARLTIVPEPSVPVLLLSFLSCLFFSRNRTSASKT